jgi:hypothetical protein
MGQVINLIETLRKALADLPPPAGVRGPPRFSVEKDSDDGDVASVVYMVDERAKADQLLKFTREVEEAATAAAEGVWVYVDFRPDDFAPAKRKRSPRGAA